MPVGGHSHRDHGDAGRRSGHKAIRDLDSVGVVLLVQLRCSVLIRRGTQAGRRAVLGAVVVDGTRRFHALGLVRILGNTQALAHAVHAALEWALGSQSSLATLGASETIFTHTRAVRATTVATALAISRARLACAARASVTSLAHAGPVL